jgi:hypothetical protein
MPFKATGPGQGTGKKVTELWVFVTDDPVDGGEGIPALSHGNILMPLVAADAARMQSFIEPAKAMAKQSGQAIRILHFKGPFEVIGELKP